jgi:hypothetical protein
MGIYNILPSTSPIAYCTFVPPKAPPTPSINFPHNTHKGIPISKFVPCVQTHILSFQRALLPTKENLEYDNEKKYQQYMPLKSMVGVVEKRNIMLVQSSDKVQTTNLDMEIKIIEVNEK